MAIDPKLFAKLIETFKDELEEQLQIITEGFLSLEKAGKANVAEVIETIFRAAHNIKGTSRSLGLNDIGTIAHHLESLFSEIQKGMVSISPSIIDLGLEGVDKIRMCMQAFLNKTPLPFDMEKFEVRLKAHAPAETEVKTVLAKSVNEKIVPTHEVGHDTIRVSLDHLDQISALMDEVQVNRILFEDSCSEIRQMSAKAAQVEQISKKLISLLQSTKNAVSEGDKALLHTYQQTTHNFASELNKVTDSMHARTGEMQVLSNTLQDEMRMLRLIPAHYLLQTMPRLVRDISHELNKEVELKIYGENVKIDKIVLDKLKDPITHILRNAIDHGIETSEQRAKTKKAKAGSIVIRVEQVGSEIHIDISDDGAGINVEKVAKIAVANNLCKTADPAAMQEAEILDFIFRPGFSTREIITDVSGRGVGLDVVQSNLNDLKGKISVETKAGHGTSFHLRVPLTLSSERGLIIRANQQCFALPVMSIERVLRIEHAEIFNVENSPAILLDQHTIPLRSLPMVLNLAQVTLPNEAQKLFVVVLKNGWNTLAFLVDDIVAERDIVIKPIKGPALSVPCLSGGTLSGTGEVILVLNPGELINRALINTSSAPADAQQQDDLESSALRILVADDSITTRTLEKNILESKGYEVTVVADGKEAWDLLQKQNFSLLITDVTMPRMDGFTLTEQVKSSDRLHDMPVIIITSLGSEAEKKRGIEVGADAYIVKNAFESGNLLQIIGQLV